MGNDADSLKALREHVAQYHNGNKQGLGRMFALQEELTGKAGQFVMLVDCKKTGPSQRRMRRGPLTGDCITFDHVQEESEATLAVAILQEERLRLVTIEDSGLYTGKVAMGKAPDGPISVIDVPITFEALQYWILFGSDGGRSEYDDGHTNRQNTVEVVAGGANIVRWVMRCSSDRIRDYHKREWLEFIYELMRKAEGRSDTKPKDAFAWFECLYRLSSRERGLSMRGTSQKTIDESRKDLKELLQQAELLGYGDDPYILDLKNQYPDLT